MKILEVQAALTPAQEQAYDWLLSNIPVADVLVLRGRARTGKTAILKKIQAERGGTLVRLPKRSSQDVLLQTIERALEAFDLVMIDDLHLVTPGRHDPSRTFLFDAALTSILAEASVARKKLVFGTEGDAPWPIRRRAIYSRLVN